MNMKRKKHFNNCHSVVSFALLNKKKTGANPKSCENISCEAGFEQENKQISPLYLSAIMVKSCSLSAAYERAGTEGRETRGDRQYFLKDLS